jgi:circadian clock protein KaiB
MTGDVFVFRLYVAGDALNSVQARRNLSAMCLRYLPDRHRIEVVDVLRDPEQALLDGILLTPTLLKLAPDPPRRILGSLSDLAPLLDALGLVEV